MDESQEDWGIRVGCILIGRWSEVVDYVDFKVELQLHSQFVLFNLNYTLLKIERKQLLREFSPFE